MTDTTDGGLLSRASGAARLPRPLQRCEVFDDVLDADAVQRVVAVESPLKIGLHTGISCEPCAISGSRLPVTNDA